MEALCAEESDESVPVSSWSHNLLIFHLEDRGTLKKHTGEMVHISHKSLKTSNLTGPSMHC